LSPGLRFFANLNILYNSTKRTRKSALTIMHEDDEDHKSLA
jgi:hypothetical protein